MAAGLETEMGEVRMVLRGESRTHRFLAAALAAFFRARHVEHMEGVQV